MPRFVRPSYLTVQSDSRSRAIGTGPNKRTGELAAVLSVRENGSVLPLFDIEAIASSDASTVLVRITDKRTGHTLFEETFKQ